MRARIPSLLLLALLAAAPAFGVVISTGDGSGNTGPPPDDPGWAHVGASSNALTGVYLGNRWVLTARHVGEPDFFFDGQWYGAVPGSQRVITQGGNTADLAMIKLLPPGPTLPGVNLPTVPIAVDDVVTMIGNGWNRDANLTCWTLMWVEVACPGGFFEGYKRNGPRTLRWGLNKVDGILPVVIGSTTTESFAMVFDDVGEPDEAQVVGGDSGGASFLKRGPDWELVGIHFAMGPESGQPSDTAVFGNASFDADVFAYRTEIEQYLLLPAGVPGLPWPALLLAGGAMLGVARNALPRRREG